MSEVRVILLEYDSEVYQCEREPQGFICDLGPPVCEGCEVEASINNKEVGTEELK